MMASFYYITTQNLEWTKFIYVYLVYLQKRNQGKNQYMKTKKKNIKPKLLNKLYFALCIIVTNLIHIYQTARLDTPYNVG